MCGTGSFLLLYNEVDNNGGQYVTVMQVELLVKHVNGYK